MKSKIFLILTSLILAISTLSCSSTGLYQYHSVSPEAYHTHYRDIPLYVDSRMTKAGQQSLAGAVNAWNYVLNGSMRIDVVDWKFKADTAAGEAVVDKVKLTHQGIVVFWLNHDDPMLEEMNADNGTLAFVNGLGRRANLLVIVEDVIGSRSLTTILEHEIGHALGAQHTTAKSLMYPYYDGGNQTSCIDKITMLQIANYNDLDPATLNYCAIPNLE